MLLLRLFVQEIEDLLPGSLSFRISESCLQFRSKDLHLVILEQFPQEVRSIEEKSLEEESETTSIKLWVIFFCFCSLGSSRVFGTIPGGITQIQVATFNRPREMNRTSNV